MSDVLVLDGAPHCNDGPPHDLADLVAETHPGRPFAIVRRDHSPFPASRWDACVYSADRRMIEVMFGWSRKRLRRRSAAILDGVS